MADHSPELCPGCRTGHPCRVLTRGHARYWELYQGDPATWGPILELDTLADAGLAGDPLAPVVAPAYVPEAAVSLDARADADRQARACLKIDSCPARSDESPGCRCEATCAERNRRVTRAECQRCQYERTPA